MVVWLKGTLHCIRETMMSHCQIEPNSPYVQTRSVLLGAYPSISASQDRTLFIASDKLGIMITSFRI